MHDFHFDLPHTQYRSRVVFGASGSNHPAENLHPVSADVFGCVDRLLSRRFTVDHHERRRLTHCDVQLRSQTHRAALSDTTGRSQTESPALCDSDLVETAIEEFLDFHPLKRHCLKIAFIIGVEKCQSLSCICEVKHCGFGFQKHIFKSMYLAGKSLISSRIP